MTFFQIYLNSLLLIIGAMTILWIVSIFLRNVSIADLFWGMGFVISGAWYPLVAPGNPARKILVLCLVTIWGLRLTVYLFMRNAGKGEDFRYREFRKKYGEKRYWWISFFQTFLLQGILMWLISAPLLGAQYYPKELNLLDIAGCAVWLLGFIFEAGGDYQLAKFRSDPSNKGKLLKTGFWSLTRHPNYFGDSAVWWGFGLICLGGGSWLPVAGSILMTLLIIKVSGVALLEKSLIGTKPGYKEYAETTNAFIPWFPKKIRK
jgi:steroid 5-alpha reductase family enzyme